MLTWSRTRAFAGTAWPSWLMSTAVLEAVRLYRRCPMHVSVVHREEGRNKWPEPVSNTTVKCCCAGRPRNTLPKYAVLYDTVLFFRTTGTYCLSSGMVTIGVEGAPATSAAAAGARASKASAMAPTEATEEDMEGS